MISRIATILLLMPASILQSQNLKTVFENSDGKQTATYWEAIEYYKMLSKNYDEVSMRKMGETDSGEPLHLVIFDTSKKFSFSEAKKEGKLSLLILNGIHPGEPDGIDASMMFLRDILENPSHKSKYKDVIIGIIPIYNIGGSLNRNSTTRVNQEGPESYGFRGNAQNYDLNRDFIKMDSKNSFSFVEIFHTVQPDVFIDTHVSNGADYQYNLTYLSTQHNTLPKIMDDYLIEEMIPQMVHNMKAIDNEPIPYVNVFNTTPDEGFSQFMDYPRYSTGYTTLFNTIGFMVETHMLKPFDVRVDATYSFLHVMTDLAIKDRIKITRMREETIKKSLVGTEVPVTYSLDKSQKTDINFKGYEGSFIESKVTGRDRLFYDRTKPFEKTIPYYNYFKPETLIKAPEYYVVPQGWNKVMDRLKVNNVIFERLKNDTTISVESYLIDNVITSESPYEGHFPHREVKYSVESQDVQFRKGDYLIPINQPAGKYIIQVLEPAADDSFLKWNLFDTILQQKEGFSPYVFEDLALEILEKDPDLKKLFEEKKKEDKSFGSNMYLQLRYIYKNSPYWESAYKRYPIYRIMK